MRLWEQTTHLFTTLAGGVDAPELVRRLTQTQTKPVSRELGRHGPVLSATPYGLTPPAAGALRRSPGPSGDPFPSGPPHAVETAGITCYSNSASRSPRGPGHRDGIAILPMCWGRR